MSGKYLILAVCALLPSTGCQLFLNGEYNLHNEPVLGCNNVSLTKKTIAYAKEAWAAYSGERPSTGEIVDFECGFIDGFSDYLDNGGTGEPPAVPPSKYRRNRYLTPEGQEAIHQYFAGFVAGSRAAKDSGIRQTLVVQIAIPPNAGGPRAYGEPPPGPAPTAPGELTVPPTRIELPAPREVPPMPPEPGTLPPPKAPTKPVLEQGLILPPRQSSETKPVAPPQAHVPPPESPLVPGKIGPAPILMQPMSPHVVDPQTKTQLLTVPQQAPTPPTPSMQQAGAAPPTVPLPVPVQQTPLIQPSQQPVPQQLQPLSQQSQLVPQQMQPVPQQWQPAPQQMQPVLQQPVPQHLQSVPQQLQPVPQQPMPQQLQPVPQQLQPIPQQSQPVPQQSAPEQLQPVPQQWQPAPEQLQPVPQQLQPVPQQLQPVPQQLQPEVPPMNPTPAPQVSEVPKPDPVMPANNSRSAPMPPDWSTITPAPIMMGPPR